MTGSGTRYEFTVEGISGPGEFSFELPASAAIVDESGNALVNGMESKSVQVDKNGPIPLPLKWPAFAVVLAAAAILRLRRMKAGKKIFKRIYGTGH